MSVVQITEENDEEESNLVEELKYVVVRIGGQLFGIDVSIVQDVLNSQNIAPIPLAPSAIAGALNLRGHIVTAIDVHMRLGLEVEKDLSERPSVVVEHENGELYSLLVDSTSEVLTLSSEDYEPNPGNLDKCWMDISKGIYRLEDELLLILDIDKLLDFNNESDSPTMISVSEG